MALLEVFDLSTHFYTEAGIARAVDGVSFSLDAGESLGIVGESGSGKSAMALSLVRLVPAPGQLVSGRVKLDGEDLLKVSELRMREVRGSEISVILQDPLASLNPVFTVGFQLGEALRFAGLKGEVIQRRSQELLESMGIAAPAKRLRAFPHQLSGGMRQRIVAAIALAQGPRVLIADEPTTSLDATIQLQFLDLLRRTQVERGLGVILITHDMGVVARVCDRVAVMYAGRIVEQGSKVVVFQEPQHPYTKALLRSVPSVDRKPRRLGTIEGQPPILTNLPKGCAFAPRCEFRHDRCDKSPPEMTVPGTGVKVRCWLVADKGGIEGDTAD